MLDDFDDLRVRDLVLLDRLEALGTITAAARELGVPKPTASRWLAGLEDKVGAALVLRGPRQVTLTPRGQAFHKQLQPALAALRTLRAAGWDDQPGGTLRVSVPVPFGRLVGGAVIARFRALMPGVRLEVKLQNERVELGRGRVDLAIRGGPLPDSSLVARLLARVELWVYASRRSEAPRPLIAAPGDEGLLRARRPELLPAVVVVDDRVAVRDALCAGVGVGILPAFLGEQPRREGLLRRVGDQPLSSIRVHAVMLPEQRQDPRVRTLIELVEQELRSLLGED